MFHPWLFEHVDGQGAPALTFVWDSDDADDVSTQRTSCEVAQRWGLGCDLQVLPGDRHGIALDHHLDEIEGFILEHVRG